MIGNTLTLDGTFQKLDDGPGAYRQLTMRLNTSATTIGVFDEDGNKVIFLKAEETLTFGPFDASAFVKPSNIYVIGTATELLFWVGVRA